MNSNQESGRIQGLKGKGVIMWEKGDTAWAGKYVRPGKWSDVIDLYDDGVYSAIWGYYDNMRGRCLGVRWNGKFGAAGYPNNGARPTWYIEPPQLARLIMLELGSLVIQKPEDGNLENILKALSECP